MARSSGGRMGSLRLEAMQHESPPKAPWDCRILGQDPGTWGIQEAEHCIFVNEEQGGNYLISPNSEMFYSLSGGEVCCFFYGLILQFHLTPDIHQL